MRTESEKGVAKRAESWEAIAEWIGASPDVLKDAVNEYNASADIGYDHIFNKDRRYLWALRMPPYYALKCRPIFLGTIGGIKINQHMEVLNQDDCPIEGLFAAGVDTGGWSGKPIIPTYPG